MIVKVCGTLGGSLGQQIFGIYNDLLDRSDPLLIDGGVFFRVVFQSENCIQFMIQQGAQQLLKAETVDGDR